MRKMISAKSIITVTAAAGLVFFTPAPRADHHKEKGDKHHEQAAKQTPEEFVKHAIEANTMEVRAAELAQQKSQSPEVKQLASTIAQHHRQAGQQLRRLAEQHNVEAETDASGKHQEKFTKLQSKSGQEFDKAFVTQVVKDHKKNIPMLEKCSEKFTSSPELKAFIDRNIPAMKKHLEMAQNTARDLNITIAADTETEEDTAAGAPATSETGENQRDSAADPAAQGDNESPETQSDIELESDDNKSPSISGDDQP